jgi:hypothetical protein
MGVTKRSVSLDAEVAEQIEVAAAEDGLSFSTWLSVAAERQLLLREGMRGVEEFETEQGALTDQERAAGEALLDRLLAGARRAHADRDGAVAS